MVCKQMLCNWKEGMLYNNWLSILREQYFSYIQDKNKLRVSDEGVDREYSLPLPTPFLPEKTTDLSQVADKL